MTPEEIAAAIAKTNKHPCNPGEYSQAITNITNILNQLNTTPAAGSLIASCTLTSDGGSCAPTTLQVTGFVPFVAPAQVAGVPIPTEALNKLNLALSGSVFGYIAFRPTDDNGGGEWEVLNLWHTFQTVLTSAPTPSDVLIPGTIGFPNTLISVPSCDNDGQDDVNLDLDVDALTETATFIYEQRLDSCKVQSRYASVKVLALEVDPAWYDEYEFENEVHVLAGVYYGDDGYVWGHFYVIRIPCFISEYDEMLLETDPCSTDSGSSGA